MNRDEKPLSTRDLVDSADARQPTDIAAVREQSAGRAAREEDRTESSGDNRAPLFEDNEASGFRTQWEAIQAGFVDEPRAAVEQADALVAQVMKRLAESFASERSTLEQQWDKGGELTTEDLRVALKRYRSFFERLLSL